jgi:hypothetical protein
MDLGCLMNAKVFARPPVMTCGSACEATPDNEAKAVSAPLHGLFLV